MDQTETDCRRVEKFADLVYTVWLSRNDYEKRCRKLLASIAEIRAEWAQITFTDSYTDVKRYSSDFQLYKQSAKRDWVTEKQDLSTLFGNVQTKLKTYRLRPWDPDPSLSPESVDAAWAGLLVDEAEHSKAINAQIRDIKEALRNKFALLANYFYKQIRKLAAEVSAIDGPLEEQQEQIRTVQSKLPELDGSLSEVAQAEAACQSANVDENDYTVFTHQDLEFELGLVVQSITKKIKFIENQIVSRNMTNLTPAQLEQFESTFRYFDKETSGMLSITELATALASMGIVYSDEDMTAIYEQLVEDYSAVTYEAWINLMVDIMEDQITPEQLRESFQGISNNKPFVTELDLRRVNLSEATVSYLQEAMPKADVQDGEEAHKEPGYNYDLWLDDLFLSS